MEWIKRILIIGPMLIVKAALIFILVLIWVVSRIMEKDKFTESDFIELVSLLQRLIEV